MSAWDHWLQKPQVPIGFNEKKIRGDQGFEVRHLMAISIYRVHPS